MMIPIRVDDMLEFDLSSYGMGEQAHNARGAGPIRRGFAFFLALVAVYAAVLLLARGLEVHGLDTLCRWDCAWYASIAGNGYVSSIPPTPQDLAGSNVAFFPMYPLLARALARLSGLALSEALPLVSILFALGVWVLLAGLVRREPGETGLKKLALLAAYPATFYLFVGYSESVYCFLLFGGILALATVLESPRPNAWLAVALVVCGFGLGLTRLTGFVIPGGVVGLFLLLALFNDRSAWPRFTASAVFALAAVGGAFAFFLWCAREFGVWNLYFQTLDVGWHKETSLRGFAWYFFRAVQKNVLPFWFAKDPTRMSWIIVSDTLIAIGVAIRAIVGKGFAPLARLEESLPAFLVVAATVHLLITTIGDSGDHHRWGNGMRYALPVFYLLVALWKREWTPEWIRRRAGWEHRIWLGLVLFFTPFQVYYFTLFLLGKWVS
jgi:hypothetical protein